MKPCNETQFPSGRPEMFPCRMHNLTKSAENPSLIASATIQKEHFSEPKPHEDHKLLILYTPKTKPPDHCHLTETIARIAGKVNMMNDFQATEVCRTRATICM